jgi:predicted nucleic acid-binding Zn ribbon protein
MKSAVDPSAQSWFPVGVVCIGDRAQTEGGAVCCGLGRGTLKPPYRGNRRFKMLWTIAVILAVLWLLGLVSSYTLGGFIHVLLVLAIAVILIQVIQGRRVG